jgi:hypothetical protein
MNETEFVSKGYGKWSNLNVPHKGWTCIDIEDLGEPLSTCEMCESQSIRYVHYMKHPEYKDILRVGCVCAGKMEENYGGAKLRDDFMKKRSSKRLRWINNSRWKISQKGNDWIKTDGYIIVMKKQDGFWRALIKSEDETFEKWSHRKYESLDEAKLAAFDYLTKILAEN